MPNTTLNFSKCPKATILPLLFFDEMLADPTVTIYIAEEDAQALGYIFCKLFERPETPFTYANRFLNIEHISVRLAVRQNGVGSALMDRAERLANDLCVRKIQLNSWDFNSKVSPHLNVVKKPIVEPTEG